jgi:hypothetical protein
MAIEQEQIRPWERQPNEGEEAFEAFDIYAKLNQDRAIVKAAALVPNKSGGLGKDRSLLERWSKMHFWVTRAAAWDRYTARNSNEEIMLGRSAMRRRLITQSTNIQTQVAQRILKMTETEIATMPLGQASRLLQLAVDIELKARNVTAAELDSGKGDFAPTFIIEFVPSKPPAMIQVRMPDGISGFIPPEQLARFQLDHPEAVVMQSESEAQAPAVSEAAVPIEVVQ